MSDTDTNPETDVGVLQNLFKSKISEQVDIVRDKLEAARQHHSDLVSQLPAAAYAQATDEPGAAEKLVQLQRDIHTADQAIMTLTLAHEEAVRREAERKRLARHETDKSRRRALEQHLAKLRTAAAQYERNVRDMAASFEAMKDASRRAGKLLTIGDKEAHVFLHPGKLVELCNAELTRQAFPQHPSQVPFALPGAPRPVIYSHDDRAAAPTLSQAVAKLCDFVVEETQSNGAANADAGLSDAAA